MNPPPRSSSANRRGPKAVRKIDPTFVVERCWTLVGCLRSGVWLVRRVRCELGEPTSVRFDGAWVLDREERRHDVQGFYHTHPSGLPRPSARDVRTMRAWCGAFGKPLLCVIESPQGVAAFRFDDDASSAMPLERLQTFPRGVMVAVESEQVR